jgi:ribosomal protein S12 methylthiotransferase accessory factor
MSMEIGFPGGYEVEARFHGLTVRTDQPPAAGGAGSAPSPFDLFLASLGTCAGFFALRFCQERGISTAALGVRLDFERSEDGKRVAAVRIEVALPPDFPDKYRDAIVRAVDQCTVKKHLLAPPLVTVETRTAAATAA